MNGALIRGKRSLVAHSKGGVQMQGKRESRLEGALLTNGNIPTKRTKLIPIERPKRARDTDATYYNKRWQKHKRNRSMPSSAWRIFPELTEKDHNYAEIPNRQITHIHAAQLQLRETKRETNTYTHTFIGRTHGPTLPDNTWGN